MKTEFDALIQDLDGALAAEEEVMAKSTPPEGAADDAAIAAAAEDGAEDDGDEIDGDENESDEDEDEGGESLTKSFRVTLADGTEAEGYDGALMIKSFRNEMGAMREDMQAALHQVGTALTRSTKLIKSLREQNSHLAAQLKAMGSQGRGRKSALSVHERSIVGDDMARQDQPQSPTAVMAKALSAQQAGRITGAEVAEIDAYFARGMTVPDPLLAKLGGLN